jgi:hypothetical protein
MGRTPGADVSQKLPLPDGTMPAPFEKATHVSLLADAVDRPQVERVEKSGRKITAHM